MRRKGKLGHLASAHFRDPAFAICNRANFSAVWPLIVDWIYNAGVTLGNPFLTAGDKTTIQNVFGQWANDCLNVSTTGGTHPEPVGVMNSLALLPYNLPPRMAPNDNFSGHARLHTTMSLALDLLTIRPYTLFSTGPGRFTPRAISPISATQATASP